MHQVDALEVAIGGNPRWLHLSRTSGPKIFPEHHHSTTGPHFQVDGL